MIVTKYVEDYVYETSNKNGNKVVIDMREDHEKGSLSPTEMLLGAVSGCVAVDIVTILKKKRKEVIDLRIETVGERKETHPRGFTQIHSKYILTSGNVKEEELHKIAGLALDKYCSVADSLKANVSFSVSVIQE
jgi:putative redox protein